MTDISWSDAAGTDVAARGSTANRRIFVNLPVADLPRATAFFTALGFTFEPQFTDDRAAAIDVGKYGHAHAARRTSAADRPRLREKHEP